MGNHWVPFTALLSNHIHIVDWRFVFVVRVEFNSSCGKCGSQSTWITIGVHRKRAEIQMARAIFKQALCMRTFQSVLRRSFQVFLYAGVVNGSKFTNGINSAKDELGV